MTTGRLAWAWGSTRGRCAALSRGCRACSAGGGRRAAPWDGCEAGSTATHGPTAVWLPGLGVPLWLRRLPAGRTARPSAVPPQSLRAFLTSFRVRLHSLLAARPRASSLPVAVQSVSQFIPLLRVPAHPSGQLAAKPLHFLGHKNPETTRRYLVGPPDDRHGTRITYRCEWDIRRNDDDPVAAIDDFLTRVLTDA